MIGNKIVLKLIFTLILISYFMSAQQATIDELKKGKRFIETRVYSQQENEELIKLFEGLRVADVSDGMDYVGLPDQGLVDPEISSLWKDVKTMDHHIRGIALTVRYVPAREKRFPDNYENYDQWAGNWYNTLSSETWTQLIDPFSVIMIDDAESEDCGSIGSYNILAWYKKGARGVVTDASSRDTDEIILERVPLYLRETGRGIRPGRNQLESVQCPIVIGGVTVCPGDVVVADGDGVIVVPRKVAKEVAQYAQNVLKNDKNARRSLYQEMDRKLDKSVK
jgi:regulator of RNase E activity RraA